MGLSAHTFSARFWSLVGATFLGFLGIGTVLPGLAPHVRHDLGGSDQTVGFVIGIFSFVALVGRLFSGPLADRRGRKSAFLAGLLSCAAMRVVMDRFDSVFSISAGLFAALGGGFLAWLAFRFWRRSLPLLCAVAMGLCSGVAGAGGIVLMIRFLTALAPAGGITSTIQ